MNWFTLEEAENCSLFNASEVRFAVEVETRWSPLEVVDSWLLVQVEENGSLLEVAACWFALNAVGSRSSLEGPVNWFPLEVAESWSPLKVSSLNESLSCCAQARPGQASLSRKVVSSTTQPSHITALDMERALQHASHSRTHALIWKQKRTLT